MSYKIEALAPYERRYKNKTKVKNNKVKTYLYFTLQDFLLLFIAFFLSRSIIMGEISPFGFPFAAYIIARRKKAWIALAMLPGLMTVQSTLYIIRAGLTLVLMVWALDKWSKESTKTWKIGLVASLCVFSTGMIFQWITGNYLYGFILLLFESITTYILLFIFSSALPLLIGGVRRKVISNDELICGAILISLTLLGMNSVSIYGYALKDILGITFILIFAKHLGSGAGATIGIIVGVVTSLTHFVSPAIIGVYAFSGLLAGIFKDLGKIPVALGFVLGNAVLTFYINGSTEVFIGIEEILIAMLLLLLAPPKIEERISSFKGMDDYRIDREKMYGDRVREVTVDRLKEYSKVFEQIGKSFEQAAVSNTLLSKNDLDDVYDRLSQEVCSKCSFYSNCWERNFHKTYQEIFNVFNKIDKSNNVDQKELARGLKNKCIHSDKMTQVLIYLYDNYKSNQYWKRQILEGKNLVSQQLKGISDVIFDLSNDMRRDIQFKKEQEEEILIAFDKEAIPIKDIMVIEDGQGKYEVTLYGNPCKGRELCHGEMGRIVSNVLGKKMTMEKHICNGNGMDDKCKVSFKEAIKFNVSTGVVRVSKDAGEDSGDSYTSTPLHDGKHMLALSDGMGSGKRAAKESGTTINLLEHFLEAGFNREIALKTINSILMLRSNDEMFSTIDLSIIDQYSGKVEFIKIGAVSTFIKRKDKVEIIASNSLPVGILEEIKIDVSQKQLEDGDVIVMVTDGFLDAIPFVEDKERWTMEALEKIIGRNPKKIAHTLLEQIKMESKQGLTDDTTILVAKVWKSIEK